ncbi:MAG: gliding motility-associated C-terminal domain-containing protein [Saprospiraceae bacterium]
MDEANGCTSTAEVEVTLDMNVPVINILPPATLTCKEAEITIDASSSSTGNNFQYEWVSQNGNIVSGQNTLLPTVDEPGNYELIILNNDNGCESSSSIIVDEDVELPSVDAGPTFELNCNLTEINLVGNTDVAIGQFTAVWSTNNGSIASGGQSLAPAINAPGVYQLEILNTETGCSNTDEVTVTENVLQDFDFEKQEPSCLNPSGILEFTGVQGGLSPFTYSVNNGQSFFIAVHLPNLPAGTYDLVVTDANGCTLSDVAYLSDPPEVQVFLEAQAILQLGDSYQLNALTSLPDSEIETVEWTPNETLSCIDCLNPLATPVQQTSYEVKVTSKDGCSATATTALFVQKNINIFVPNAFSPNGDGTNDLLLIYAGGNGILKINSFLIFSRWGESVFQQFNFPPNDPQYGWNGKHKGELMDPAVFVWFAEVELIDGSTRLLEGGVTLIR